MQEEEQQPEFVQYFQGFDKKVELKELDEFDVILPHEHLFQNYPPANKNQRSVQINVQTINQIKQNPQISWENLVLAGSAEQDNEMKQFQKTYENSKKKPAKVLIVESTSKDNALNLDWIEELYRANNIQCEIGFGYTYQIDKKGLYSDNEKNLILYSIENITQQIKYEFAIGNKDEKKPAYIGEICLDQVDLENPIEQNILISYFQVSNEYNTPIYFNLQNNQQNYVKLEDIIKRFSNEKCNQTVYIAWNPFISFEFTETSTLHDNQLILQKNCSQIKQLLEILQKGLTIGFDTIRYEQMQYELGFLIKQICNTNNFSDQILLSSGVTYKTDIFSQGGSGYYDQINYVDSILRSKLINLQDEHINKMIKSNFVNKFLWAKYKVEKVKIVYWSCQMCKKEYDESTIDKFKKFGKEFCSMKCLKKFLD